MMELFERREGANADNCLYIVERCRLIIRTLSDIERAICFETSDDSEHSFFTILSEIRDLIRTVRDISKEWDKLLDTIEGSSSLHAYLASSNQNSSVGQPRVQISREQLVYLRSLNFFGVIFQNYLELVDTLFTDGEMTSISQRSLVAP